MTPPLSRPTSLLRATLLLPCLLAPSLPACSSAPGEPAAASGASALDPNQVLNPTYYKVTLSKVFVANAVEPYQAGNMVNYGDQPWPRGASGIPGYAPNASISQTPGGVAPSGVAACNNYDSMVWTPDTGYVYAAQLGVKVTPTQSGGSPFLAGNPYSTACTMGHGGTGTTFQGAYCQKNAFNATFTNGHLEAQFYVNPGDQVALGLALDNVETTDVTSVVSILDGQLSTAIKDFGDVGSLAGAYLATLAAAAPELGLVGIIGAAATAAGDVLGVGSVSTCPASAVAKLATSCQGGLVGPPTNPACSSGWPGASTVLQGCNFGGLSPDFIRIADPTRTDPSTGRPLDLTAERLQEITALGPATFEFNPSFDLTNPHAAPTWYGVPRGGNAPGLAAGCASNVKLDVTIERLWDIGPGGPAASAKSGDMAVVRGPGTIDTFASSPAYPNQLLHDWGSGTSFSSEEEAPASSIEASGVSVSTIPAVVSRTPSNLDMFYVDGNGSLNTVFQSAPTYAWSVETLVSALRIGRVNVASVAPPNALVTATARSPESLDVFFVGTDGNVWTTYWNGNSGKNAQGLPAWATAFTTTQGRCILTNGPCAGSGSPGGGVAVVARNPNQLDLFYVGVDGGLWTSFWYPSIPWTTMALSGPHSQIQPGPAFATPGAPITAVARTSENLDVFFVGQSGELHTAAWWEGNNQWGTWAIPGSNGTGPTTGAPISAVARQPGTIDVVYPGTNGTLEWGSWSSQQGWRFVPIPQAGGVSTAPYGRGAVSIVAPTAFTLQAFYMNAFHQENTVSWSDPCSSLAPNGCDSSPVDFPWSGEITLPEL